MIRRRVYSAPFLLLAAMIGIAACNEGGGVASPSNTPHGSRCLMDTDCMGGYDCSKGKGDILGECVPKTMGGAGAGGGGGGGGGSAKPASSGGAGPASSSGGGAGKPVVDPPKGNGKPQTPEPLPPPKPPKDAKPADASTFSP